MLADTMNMKDNHGRAINYLRISVTDKCNLNCRYCSPAEEKNKTGCDTLTYEELLFVVSVFAKRGINRIRLTGGEPLVRNNLTDFISQLNNIEGMKDVTLTTNGLLLGKYADKLADVGLCRLNISLDSLKEEKYNHITQVGGFDRVMAGIDTALAKGFSPVKVNVVVIRGFNDDEIPDFCRFAAEKNVIVRFIEFMPIGNSPDWNEKIVSGQEVIDIIRKEFGVKKVEKTPGTGPAERYVLSNGAEIGIITPISNHFCDKCDKLRLTADGNLRLCLLSDKELSVKEAARARDVNLMNKIIEEALGLKQFKHEINLTDSTRFCRTMSKIGG
jgi:cyclic pyranopterin phosphate synthase